MKMTSNKRPYIPENKSAGRFITFYVPGFWDKNTGMCDGAIPYRRDVPAIGYQDIGISSRKRHDPACRLILRWLAWLVLATQVAEGLQEWEQAGRPSGRAAMDQTADSVRAP